MHQKYRQVALAASTQLCRVPWIDLALCSTGALLEGSSSAGTFQQSIIISSAASTRNVLIDQQNPASSRVQHLSTPTCTQLQSREICNELHRISRSLLLFQGCPALSCVENDGIQYLQDARKPDTSGSMQSIGKHDFPCVRRQEKILVVLLFPMARMCRKPCNNLYAPGRVRAEETK